MRDVASGEPAARYGFGAARYLAVIGDTRKVRELGKLFNARDNVRYSSVRCRLVAATTRWKWKYYFCASGGNCRRRCRVTKTVTKTVTLV